MSDKINIMVKRDRNNQNYVKVVDERYTLPVKRGGGTIKIEAWEDTDGKLIFVSPEEYIQNGSEIK